MIRLLSMLKYYKIILSNYNTLKYDNIILSNTREISEKGHLSASIRRTNCSFWVKPRPFLTRKGIGKEYERKNNHNHR
jgi:hypothetical protein